MTNEPIDQIANLIKDLKENPDSRRLMVNSWNPAEIDQMTLPPCHYGFQCYTRELNIDERINLIKSKEDDKLIIASCENPADEHLAGLVNSMLCKHNIPTRALSLQWNQRSVDTPLGLPFNIASYGLLLEILAKICNMVPDELIGNLGDTHIYNNQVEGCIEQIGREMTLEERRQLARANGLCPKYPFEIEDNKPIPNKWTESEWYDRYRVPTRTREPFQLPTLKHMKTDAFWKSFDVTLFGHLDPKDFQLENYQSHPTIKFPLSN
jgi:thymidylate synthase